MSILEHCTFICELTARNVDCQKIAVIAEREKRGLYRDNLRVFPVGMCLMVSFSL